MTTKHVPKNSPSFIRTLVDALLTKRSIVRDAFWKSSNPKMLVGRSPKYAGWHSTVTRLSPHKIKMCKNSQYEVKYLDGGLFTERWIFSDKFNIFLSLFIRRSAIFKKGSWKRVPNSNQIVFMYYI